MYWIQLTVIIQPTKSASVSRPDRISSAGFPQTGHASREPPPISNKQIITQHKLQWTLLIYKSIFQET